MQKFYETLLDWNGHQQGKMAGFPGHLWTIRLSGLEAAGYGPNVIFHGADVTAKAILMYA